MHVNPNARPAITTLPTAPQAGAQASTLKKAAVTASGAASRTPSGPDRVELSPAALRAGGAASSRRDVLVAQRPSLSPAQSAPGDAQQTPSLSARTAPEPEASRTFTKADLAQLLDAWGRTEGQEGFNADLDLNADGLIDGADLGMLLGSMSGEAPEPEAPPAGTFTQQDLKSLLSMFGAEKNSRGFDARYDLDGDGRISGADLAHLLGMLGPQGG